MKSYRVGKRQSTKYDWLKVFYSCLIALGIAASSVIGTQIVKKTYTEKLSVAFLFTYITTMFNLILIPLYFIFHYTIFNDRKPIKTIVKECVNFIDGRKITDQPRYAHVCLILAGFTILWLGANYTYLKSIQYLTPTDVAALFSTSNVFVFILSLIVLKDLFYFTKLFSVVIATSAVVLYFYAGNLELNKTIGVVLVMFSSFFSALYKVIYKKIIKNGKLIHVLFTLIFIGFASTVTTWILLIVFHYTKFEVIPPVQKFPWLQLFVRGISALVMNLLINFGIAYTSSIVVSIGALLSIPINAIIDVVFRKDPPNLLKGIAATLIALSFVMIILPDRFLNKVEPFWNRERDERISSEVEQS